MFSVFMMIITPSKMYYFPPRLDDGGAIEHNRSVAIIKVSQTENPDYQLRDVWTE